MGERQKLTLEVIESRIQQLPLLPGVLYELMRLDRESSHFFDKASELAVTDPPLAARVLQLANSAAAAPSEPIVNMHDALIRIGVNRIYSLITAAAVARVFTPVKEGQKALWRHAIETAHIAHYIASNFKESYIDEDLAYTCGLLHDIGRFVLLEISDKALEATDARGWESPVELPLVEHRVLGFTHAEVGHIAAHKWQLPKVVDNLIHYHHRYDLWKNDKGTEPFRYLLTIIQMADLISVLLIKNPEWQTWEKADFKHNIIEKCIHKDWPEITFPIDGLVKDLPEIMQQCQDMLHNLGIHMEE